MNCRIALRQLAVGVTGVEVRPDDAHDAVCVGPPTLDSVVGAPFPITGQDVQIELSLIGGEDAVGARPVDWTPVVVPELIEPVPLHVNDAPDPSPGQLSRAT